MKGETTSSSLPELVQKPLLFKTSAFKPEEIESLRKVCEQMYGKNVPLQCREGTKEEWEIVQGLVEGNILARQMPQFIKRIMSFGEQVRLVQTIRAQVEGCLVLDLKGESPIKEAFLNTRSIQESISTAATARGKGTKKLWAMIAQVKTISYNAANHALYFRFFTRTIAEKFDGVKVPFHRLDHVLTNLHKKNLRKTGTAWDQQLNTNGELFQQHGTYTCILKNITRSIDLVMFYGSLHEVFGMGFHVEDLDKGGPFSSTSTEWEFTFFTDSYPAALQGILRIPWFDTMIVVEHPTMRGRRQCMRCGMDGHPMRACTATIAALKKESCLIITQDKIKGISYQNQHSRA